MSRYTSATEQDRSEMLAAIGAGSLEELFEEVPEGVRLGRELELDPGRSEQEVFDELSALAARNRHCDEETSFLGAGMYDHYVPALVDSILQRSEFLTPYTPYQPEISQGGLQVMFEFQTAISELTGLPVANASVYEGPSAVAAAGYLAKLETGRTKLLASRGLHPHSRGAGHARRGLPDERGGGAADRRGRHRRGGAGRRRGRRHSRRLLAAA
jgi:glycine dehydrogenase subunit 1